MESLDAIDLAYIKTDEDNSKRICQKRRDENEY